MKPLRTVDDLLAHIAALEKERDAALADNAALLKAMRPVCADCSSPDGTFKSLIHAVQNMGVVACKPHPGAALLEEHRKALVRARNEGLEKAASDFDREADGTPGTQWERTCRSHAERIRAKKEPES